MMRALKVRLSNNPGCQFLGFAVFLAFGLLNSYDLIWKPWGSWLAARSWKQVRCTIVSSKVVETSGARIETWYVADLAYSYVADGLVRRGTRYNFEPTVPSKDLVALYPKGKVTTCWVDPENPEEAVLSRDVSMGTLIAAGIFPLLFLIAGAGGIVWVLSGVARKGSRSL